MKLHADDAHRLAWIVRQLQRFFWAGESPEPGSQPTLSYYFEDSAIAEQLPLPGVEISRSEIVVITKEDDCILLHACSSRLEVDVANSHCRAILADEFWRQPLEHQRAILFASFLFLIAPMGRFGLHANGLVSGRTGYLLVGDSGSGKTTLSVAMVRQGWHHLSDDTLILQATGQGVAALPVRRGFSFTARTVEYFPEIAPLSREAPTLLRDKKLVDISPAYPGRSARRTVPAVLLFPVVAEANYSQLIPMDPRRTIFALLKHSYRLPAVDRQVTDSQMRLLKQLAAQSRAYQLLVGRDVYEEPRALAERLGTLYQESR